MPEGHKWLGVVDAPCCPQCGHDRCRPSASIPDWFGYAPLLALSMIIGLDIGEMDWVCKNCGHKFARDDTEHS
ncbi:MAG: hypothetical protein AAGD00_08420 [Planctomycetota bacterium]